MEFLNAWQSQRISNWNHHVTEIGWKKARRHAAQLTHSASTKKKAQANENKNKLVIGTCSRCIHLALCLCVLRVSVELEPIVFVCILCTHTIQYISSAICFQCCLSSIFVFFCIFVSLPPPSLHTRLFHALLVLLLFLSFLFFLFTLLHPHAIYVYVSNHSCISNRMYHFMCTWKAISMVYLDNLAVCVCIVRMQSPHILIFVLQQREREIHLE